MNARAHDLTVTLRAILRTLPGASSISVHASETWAIIMITAASDEAVLVLGEDLGLGASEVRSAEGQWWRRTMSEADQGTLHIVVAGPLHLDSPPSGSDEAASSHSE